MGLDGLVGTVCVTNKEFISKDGIHIIFPNILLKRDIYKGIMSLLQEGQIIESIFEETCEVAPANKKDTLMDGCFASWQPYGCSKVNESPYLLTQVFNISDSDIPVQIDEDTFQEHYSGKSANLNIAKKMSVVYREEETVTYSDELHQLFKDKGFKNSPPTEGTMAATGGKDIYDDGRIYYADNNNVINPFKIVEEEKIKYEH